MNKSLLISLITIGPLVLAGIGIFVLNPNFLNRSTSSSSTKVSSCVVLDEQYCKNYQIIDYNGKFFGLGFKLASDSKLYSPFKSLVSTNTSVTMNGKKYDAIRFTESAQGNDQPQVLFAFISHQAIGLDLLAKVKQGAPLQVQPGDFIANVSNQAVDIFGDYDLVLSFWRYNAATHLDDPNLDLTKQFFVGVKQ